MNKLELVEHVAGETETSKAAAAAAIDAVIDGITKALKKGDEVRLVGFGTFSVKKRAAVQGPQSRHRRRNQDSGLQERPFQARRDPQGGAQQEQVIPTPKGLQSRRPRDGVRRLFVVADRPCRRWRRPEVGACAFPRCFVHSAGVGPAGAGG